MFQHHLSQTDHNRARVSPTRDRRVLQDTQGQNQGNLKSTWDQRPKSNQILTLKSPIFIQV